MTKTNLRPPIKIHGGKWYLRDFIIENFPDGYENLTYIEPFCGGASVFFNKKPSAEEVIGDINQGLIFILKALRDEPQEFISKLKKIRYTETVFKKALQKSQKKEFDDYVEHATNEYVLRRMSRGGMKKAFAWSDRKRGGQPGDVNAWKTMLKELPRISQRLQKTTILCSNFVDILKVWDEDNSLFYLDPTYLHSTRSESATKVYENEMTVEDHMNLLHLAKNARGKVIISGYSSPLYNRILKNWRVKKKNIANHSSQVKIKERRVEMLWMNY